MASPNVSHSVTLRVELDNRPGTLGRLTTAIGEVGGNLLGVDLVDVDAHVVVRDITVLTADPEHAEQVRRAAEGVAGVRVRSMEDRVFRLHQGGKIEVRGKAPLLNRDDLAMAYTPGVARVSLAIAEQPSLVHSYTVKANSVAVVTDGTAVLGLGNIGPEAALPVMEGKAQLFKEFGGVDAFPLPVRASSVDELVETVAAVEPVFGGINLEDIAAPRCFEVEAKLAERLSIPVFHDDQHGTAVVVLAALRNACRVVGKKIEDLSVVIAGAGAAGVASAKILAGAGVGRIVVADRKGLIYEGREEFGGEKAWLAANTNPDRQRGSVGEALAGADVFIGVSGPEVVSRDDVATMAKDPIVFALANPTPELLPEEIEGLAAVVATGRSDYPNQINNVLCFPGIFRGALDARATAITEGMKLAAAEAIASRVTEDELAPTVIVPSVFDREVAPAVAKAVAHAAVADGVIRADA
ncbi:NAD-dependent malic enzyme [Aciditerrimonas ferrireducens]|jgi:malate dehydrogenase (oxaloacetate-decarboxylating)|uniref:NAD-dependent malic enzyme n=1 Tax=Aciditerrimonas ferrireducens TaxID=667306 RepID=UPI00200577DB|nr:NAD-dependent malic enzyme [Aciditerrimonas ferrireducens]MCK4178177.1 NAD-dependent malic enzyme [Aciditerrimonas ferrireducens]